MKYRISRKRSTASFPIFGMRLFIIWAILFSFSVSMHAQVSAINNDAANDTYGVLRGMVEQTKLNSDSDFSHVHRLHGNDKYYIQYFIGPQSFLTRGDLDIYNHIIYTDFDNMGIIRPFQIERGRIDSLHLLLARKGPPIAKYIYDANNDQYGKIIHQGRYDIVEGIGFEMQKGGFNPVVDSEPRPNKVVIKKSNYLIDLGIWYSIPKSKKELLDFIKFHFKKKVDKSKLKGKKSLDVVMDMN